MSDAADPAKTNTADPKDAKDTKAKDEAAKTATAEPREWKPKKGAPCVVVYVGGGPRLIESRGKLTSDPRFDKAKGAWFANVECSGPRGNVLELENLPWRERGGAHEGAHFLEPEPARG